MNISTLDQVFDKTVKTLRFLYFDHTLSLSSQSSSPHQARAEHQQTEVCTLCRGADAGGAFDVSSHYHHYCTRPPPYHQPQTSYTLYDILYIQLSTSPSSSSSTPLLHQATINLRPCIQYMIYHTYSPVLTASSTPLLHCTIGEALP